MDEDHQYLFATTNFGEKVTGVMLPFKPKKLLLHKRNFELVLGMDDNDPEGVVCIADVMGLILDPLPNNKILHWSKFKAFADENLNLAQMIKFVFDEVENILGKEENAS